ncbi:hypothetical protein BGZ83_001734, partial [Gryganskiella cystojenkinii]
MPDASPDFEQIDLDIIHYDVKACHFGDLTKELTSINHIDEHGSLNLDKAMSALATTIHEKILVWLGGLHQEVDIILHIDGFGSDAKGVTHEGRHLKREKASGEIGSNLRILERKKGRWVSAKVTEKIDKNLRAACQLTPEARDILAAQLEALNCKVCLCRAETDPCIATHCSNYNGKKEPAVLSVDSDYLFYSGVKTLLRPNPKGPGLLCYERAQVKKALGLVHDEELILYGCVNRNDYNRNIPTIGLIKSLKMIRPPCDEDDEDVGSDDGNSRSSLSSDDLGSEKSNLDDSDSDSDPDSDSGSISADLIPTKKTGWLKPSHTARSSYAWGKAPFAKARSTPKSTTGKRKVLEDQSSDDADSDADDKGPPLKSNVKRSKPGQMAQSRSTGSKAKTTSGSKARSSAVVSTESKGKGKAAGYARAGFPNASSSTRFPDETDQDVLMTEPLDIDDPKDKASATCPDLRELLQRFCEKATAAIGKDVSPSLFESSIRTFGFLSQLKKGETPSSNPEYIPLWKPNLDSRSSTSLPPVYFPPLPAPKMSEDDLMRQVQQQLERTPPARAAAVVQQAQVGDRKTKKKKRKPKKEQRKTRRKGDRKKTQPKGTSGINPTRATTISRDINKTYEKRALTVGSFQRNVFLRLLRREGIFDEGTDDYNEACGRAKQLADEISKRHRSCIETRELLLHDTYAAVMLAIEDIHNPINLKAQSIQMLAQQTSSSTSSSSTSERHRWDLPEKYPDSMMEDLVDSKTIYYALTAFFFKGKAAPNSEDSRIQKAAEEAEKNAARKTRGTRQVEKRSTDDKAFFARWIFERYKTRTSFVPYDERGIQIFNANGTRSTQEVAFNAISCHYKYAVFDETIKWVPNKKPGDECAPAIRWFQEHNKDSVFKDFVFGKSARNIQTVTEVDLFYFLNADPPSQPQPLYLSEASQQDFKPLLKDLFPRKKVGSGKNARTGDLTTDEKISYIIKNKGWFITSIVYDLAREDAGTGDDLADKDKQSNDGEEGSGPKRWKPRKDGYCHKIRLQSETYLGADHNYILGTGYHTDGKVLTLLANDARALRTYRKKKSHFFGPDEEETAAAAASATTAAEDDEDDDDEFDDDPAEGINLSEHLYELDPEKQYEFHRPPNLTQFVTETKSGFKCNLAARTRLLPNAAVLNWNVKPKVVIGADPGEIVAVATTRLDQASGERHTKKIKRTFLYEPYWRFKRALDGKKKECFIDKLESLTPPRKLGSVSEFFNYMNSP